MSQPKYIQDENVFLIIALTVICVVIIWWTYSSDKKRDLQFEKKNETVDSYTKSFSWRLYIIIGTGLGIMIWELVKRFINFFYIKRHATNINSHYNGFEHWA